MLEGKEPFLIPGLSLGRIALYVLVPVPLVMASGSVADSDYAFEAAPGLIITAIWAAWLLAVLWSAMAKRSIDMPYSGRAGQTVRGEIESASEIRSPSGRDCAGYAIALSYGCMRPFAFDARVGELTVRLGDGTRLLIPAGAARVRSRARGQAVDGDVLWAALAPRLTEGTRHTSERLLLTGARIAVRGRFDRRVDPDAARSGDAGYRQAAASMLVARGLVSIDI